MKQQTPTTSYVLWYHSNSHKKDRWFTGAETILVMNIFPAPKPTWTYNKDEAFIFDSMQEAEKAKAFCEACQYKELKIEPIDGKPIWAPPETVTVN